MNGMTCKILDVAQGSDEWLDARRRIFTASEGGEWMMEEPKCRLTKAEMLVELESLGIEANPKAKNDELEALFPDISPHLSLTAKAVSARDKLIRRKLGLHTKEGVRIEEEENRRIGYDFDVQRGKELEPFARDLYQTLTGSLVVEAGLCAHESCQFDLFGMPEHGFGCSPDGLIESDDQWVRGLEIKCPRPDKLMEWLDAKTLPAEHAAQVHMSMAVTGLKEWDFMAFCPEMPPLIVRVRWSEETNRILETLRWMHGEFLARRTALGRQKAVIIGVEMEAT